MNRIRRLIDVRPGHLFLYRERRHFSRRQSGAGQVLAIDSERKTICVRLFDVSGGDELKPFIGFVSITFDAFVASEPEVMKELDLPTDWKVLQNALIQTGILPAPTTQSPQVADLHPPGTTASILPEGLQQDVGNAGLVQSTEVVGMEPNAGVFRSIWNAIRGFF